jgi:hypothetical protein
MGEKIELLGLPRNRITESIRGQAGRCMYSVWLEQFKGYQGPGNTSLALGNGIHAALSWADLQQIEGNPRPSIERIQDNFGKMRDDGDPKQPLSMFEGALRIEIAKSEKYAHQPIIWEEGDTPASLVDEGRRMIATAEEKWAATLSPVASEWNVELTLKDKTWRVTGRLDLVNEEEGRFYLIDRKTGGKLKTIFDLVTSGQHTTYQKGWVDKGGKVDGLAIHSIQRPTKENPNGRAVTIGPIPPRTPEEIAAHLEDLANTVGMIRAGYFPKAHNWTICNGFCSHLETCEPKWYALKQKVDAEKKAEKARVAEEKQKEKDAKKSKTKKPAGEAPAAK